MISFTLDGRTVDVPDDGESLLYALREHLGCRSPKDGCSLQGQCGCCTVWIDGSPRVSCVTPARRVAGRAVTTTDGLPTGVRDRWAQAFVAAGASQCGFCTPGIVMRLAALEDPSVDGGGAAGPTSGPITGTTTGTTTGSPKRGGPVHPDRVRTALLAHLCRCTGWQTVVEAACDALGVPDSGPGPTGAGGDDSRAGGGAGGEGPGGLGRAVRQRDPLLIQWRAQIEGPAYQVSGPQTVLGAARFADDTAPPGALVATPGADGELVVADSLVEARSRSHKVQGRNSTEPLVHPVAVPEGDWDLTLQTTWVEPAYLEPDASWCQPGSVPATPLANGGAFGGKRRSPVAADSRRLADQLQAPVRVLWSREDVTRRGPKRPPIAAGVRRDGHGTLRFARSTGPGCIESDWAADREAELLRRVEAVAPALAAELVDVTGPPTSVDLRGTGWVEAAVLVAGLRALLADRVGPGWPAEITSPAGGRARATVHNDDAVEVHVWAGDVLDETTLRSYCIGAVHQALGWVWHEGIAVDDEGHVRDLTVRSFGIITARDMPHVDVSVHPSPRWPVNGSDAVFAATAAAAWVAEGLAPRWPTRGRGTRP
ncbi:MAG: (2Fe-2S)-binding protein [Acidimicrobiales bacterium]